MIDTTFYLCKGNNPTCSFVGCSINGGECKHTTNPDWAINEPCEDPKNHPERFEVERIPIGGTSSERYVIYYWEKEIHNENEEISD